jgi:SAM-dependent methyltransferase
VLLAGPASAAGVTVGQAVIGACVLCGGRDSRPLFERFGHSIVRCGRCGLVTCAGSFSNSFLAGYYSEGYFRGAVDRRGYHDYDADESLIKASFAHKLRLLERFTCSRGSLLDVGCAKGYFMEVARAAGWAVAGVDISAYATAAAGRRGLNVVRGDAPGMFRSAVFDAVTMWDVVEHLPDPVAALRDVHRTLRPGGVLGLSTGAIDSLLARLRGAHSRIFNPPQHLFFFSRRTLDACLRAAGFEVVGHSADHKVVSLRYVLHLQSSLAPGSWWYALARRLMRLPVNPSFPVWIPDNVVIFAKKPLPGRAP